MKRNIIAIAIVATIFGCQNADNKSENADTISAQEMKIATADNIATKIIKTADMRFRVKDVQSTKEQLSKIINGENGTVAEFSIESIIQETQKVKQSPDSLKEITSYRTEGYMVAKVPSEKVDQFTSVIAKMAVFVNSSSMKMDDQSIIYLANKLKAQNRTNASNQIAKIPNKEIGNVKTSLALNDDYVDRKIDNIGIDALVKYSTITLNFYQDNTIKTSIVANDNIYDYKPAFADRLWLNILNGWIIFKEIILALANLWMFALIGIGVFFIARHYVKKNKLAMDLSTKSLVNSNHS